jgi:hypothetical protein
VNPALLQDRGQHPLTPDERLSAILAIARAARHAPFWLSVPEPVRADIYAIEQLAEEGNWPPDCWLCGKPMTAEHDQLSPGEHAAQNPYSVVVMHAES